MSDAPFLCLTREGHVARLTISRPEKRNALGPEFWDGLAALVAEIDADDEIRALVVHGAGPCFTAGLDVLGMLPQIPIDPSGGPPDGRRQRDLHTTIRRMQAAITSLERCRVPVIAAIHGWCLGGGVDLITACDLRFCSADARFGVRETRLAMVADVGTLQRLPRIVGPGVARELVFTGRDFDAATALRIGLVERVCADGDAVLAEALTVATEIAANPPLTVQGAKRVMVEADRAAIDQGLEYVATWNAAHLNTRDLAAAVGAMATRAVPRFEGR